MIRKLVCSMIVLAAGIGLVAAEEFSANISKVEGKNVTFTKTKKGKKDGEATTLPVAKGVVTKKGTAAFKDGKFSVEPGDAIEGGLKNDLFTKIDEKKGLTVRITTAEDNKTITNITVVTFDFKKKKDVKKTDK